MSELEDDGEEEGYRGPERRRDRVGLEARLTRLEITQKFILRQGNATHDEMVRGLQKLATMLEDVKSDVTEQGKTLTENSADIHWLKSWLWKTAGATAFVSSVVAWLLKHL